MAKTVIGLVDTPAEAEVVVLKLLKEGFDRAHVGRRGSLAGLLLGVAALAIPGAGPVIKAGPALASLERRSAPWLAA